MLELRFRRWWLAGAWLIVATLVIGSLLPGPVAETVSVWDKGEHFFGYFVLSLWLVGLVPPRRYMVAAALAIGLGAGIEVAQGVLTTTRQMDGYDVLANAIGVSAAWLAARLGLGGWAQRVEQIVAGATPRP